jgi:pilus assembly protein CpaF
LLNALNTGHEGGACTLHANSPSEVPARLEALAALGGLGRAALHSQLLAAVRVILHMKRTATGVRRLDEVGVLRQFNGVPRVVTVWRDGRWTDQRRVFADLVENRKAALC